MKPRGSWVDAFSIFFEEARAFARSTEGDKFPEDAHAVLAAHRACIATADRRMHEIGWSFEEFREHQPSAAEQAERDRIVDAAARLAS